MSFQNYEPFQNQQGQQDAGGAGLGAPPPQDSAMGGQMPENAGQQFQGGNGGDPGSAGSQQGGDTKTTLWYVPRAGPLASQPMTDLCRSALRYRSASLCSTCKIVKPY